MRLIRKPTLWFPVLADCARRVGVARGQGKRGGVRAIYYYWVSDNEVYMLYLYAKNEQADMDAAGRGEARKFVEALKRGKENKRDQAKSRP